MTKSGKCTWCTRIGILNNYSSNLQGREINCTGLCSKKCFEQAVLKILNFEADYGLESSANPESVPIRTSLENLNYESHDRRTQFHDQPRYESVPHIDTLRYHPGMARGSDALRSSPAVTTPPAVASVSTTRSIGPMLSIDNIKSLHPVEQTCSSKKGKTEYVYLYLSRLPSFTIIIYLI